MRVTRLGESKDLTKEEIEASVSELQGLLVQMKGRVDNGDPQVRSLRHFDYRDCAADGKTR